MLSTYFNTLADAGLDLDAARQAAPSGRTDEDLGPVFFVARCRHQ
jgi:hypothetical protein